jgi:hypothetical protein
MRAQVQAPAAFAPVLARLEADAAEHFRISPLRLVPSGCVERPFSYVMRVEALREGGASLVSRLYVKLFKSKAVPGDEIMRKRVAHDYEITGRVHAWMSQHDDLGAVRPVVCYPEHLAIVTEEVPGPTLHDYVLRRIRWPRSTRHVDELNTTMATVGRWLRVFQSIDAPAAYVTINALRQYIDHRLQRLVRDGGGSFTEVDRAAVLRHIERLGSQILEHELAEVAIHADMSLGNLVVCDRRVVVLDFAMSKRGSSLHDLTRLFLQLDLLAVKPDVRSSVIRQLQSAMIRGFDPLLTPERPLFRLLALLHRVNHLTTLSVHRAPFVEEMYNAIVRRRHRQSLAAELRCDGAALRLV